MLQSVLNHFARHDLERVPTSKSPALQGNLKFIKASDGTASGDQEGSVSNILT
jgi:hypothetical protein